MKQGSTEWHKARKSRITASAIGKMMIGGPMVDELLQDLVRDALGYPRAFQGNVATEYGQQNEPIARLEYVMQTGNAVEDAKFYVHPELSWMGASPDGLIGDDGLLELKCPYKLRNADEVPDSLVEIDESTIYWHQMQCQMHVKGREWCDFGVWCPGGIKIRRYHRVESWIDEAKEKGEALLEQVQTILADPELAEDSADMTQDMSGDGEWRDIAAQYTFLDDQIKALKGQQDELKCSLIEMAGKRKAVGHGVQVIPVKRQGSVDYKAMAESAGVNPDDYRKPASTSWQVRISKED